MKLKDACEIAIDCGLDMTGEALMNIEIHAISIFPYDKINEEITELRSEYDVIGDISVQEYLNNIK